jgi:hypothetical protein
VQLDPAALSSTAENTTAIHVILIDELHRVDWTSFQQ